MKLEIHASLSEIGRDAWNALARDASPFLDWEWLVALEESGCASRQTGWYPQHLTLWEGGQLIAACPLYVKGHSQGEFVFDHGWADAAHRAGIRYFPKLLVGIPFTPATGPRLLVSRDPGLDPTRLRGELAQLLADICRRNSFSSVHVNFCPPEDLGPLEAHGFRRRTGYQFQWRNRGWRDFDDYLESFRSKRRVQIRRERRELESQGIEIETYSDDIPAELFPVMFRIYKSTIDKLYWGRQYLNEAFFERLAHTWRHRLVFFVARRNGNIVAGTFTVRHADALYGRYWGCFEEHRYLHFNLCYYASIEYCLKHGLQRFEPGAGGEFKYLRGFDPHPTESAHFIADPRLAQAIADYLERERPAIGDEIEWMQEHSALKRDPGADDT